MYFTVRFTCCCMSHYIKPLLYSLTLDQVMSDWKGLVSGSGFCYLSFGRSSVSPCSGRDDVEVETLALRLVAAYLDNLVKVRPASRRCSSVLLASWQSGQAS